MLYFLYNTLTSNSYQDLFEHLGGLLALELACFITNKLRDCKSSTFSFAKIYPPLASIQNKPINLFFMRQPFKYFMTVHVPQVFSFSGKTYSVFHHIHMMWLCLLSLYSRNSLTTEEPGRSIIPLVLQPIL